MSLIPRMTLPLPTPPPPAVVMGDLPCRKCSYNLRTLPTDALCPECGTPVAVSMRSDRLRDADPQWLRIVRGGVSLLWITYLLLVLWLALGALLRVSDIEGRWIQIPLGRLLAGVGIWMATTPDPRRQSESGFGRFSMACRAAALISFATGIAWLGVMHRYPPSSAIWFAARQFDLAAEIVNRALILFYLSRLMLRIPDATLSRTMWWSAMIVTVGWGIEFAMRLSPSGAYFLYRIVPGLRLLIDFVGLAGLVLVLNALRLCNSAIRRESR